MIKRLLMLLVIVATVLTVFTSCEELFNMLFGDTEPDPEPVTVAERITLFETDLNAEIRVFENIQLHLDPLMVNYDQLETTTIFTGPLSETNADFIIGEPVTTEEAGVYICSFENQYGAPGTLTFTMSADEYNVNRILAVTLLLDAQPDDPYTLEKFAIRS